MKAEITTLTRAETDRLTELEQAIQKGQDTFIEVGAALMEIRDSRIYRGGFPTFEEYCLGRWNFSSRRAFQFISASQVVSNVNNCSQTEPPATESQARPLAKLPPEKQSSALEAAREKAKADGKPMTARHVEEAVSETLAADTPKFPLPPQNVADTAKGEEAEKDSEKLWLLKSAWRNATKKDRCLFMEWARNQ
jgi:hypothetical protein